MISGYLGNRSMGSKDYSNGLEGPGSKRHEVSAGLQETQVFKHSGQRAVAQDSDTQASVKSLFSTLNALMPALERLLQNKTQRPEQTTVKKTLIDKFAINDSKQSLQSPVDSHQYPALSKKKKGERPTDVWAGVMYGTKNNEPALSAIKAAMMKYGQSPLGVFSSVVRSDSGYKVVMRDGFELHLTLKEIARAKVFSGFQHGPNPEDGGMYKDVAFMYAASAKRAQLEHVGGTPNSFMDGLNTLCSNQDPATSLKQLGLEGVMRLTTWPALLQSGGIGVVKIGGNTNFAFEGMVDGCTTKQRLPDNHRGVTYELI